MNIEEIYNRFSNKMVQVSLYVEAAKSLMNEELKSLNQYAKAMDENPELKETYISFHAATFRDIRTGNLLYLGAKNSSIEDRKLAVVLHKNKQYQWLLAEAYEEFEDLIEAVYACCGLNDPNFWPLADYGNVTLAEMRTKEFDWHLEQASKKKNGPIGILEVFRKKWPELNELDRDNSFDIHLKFAIILIEKLRHIIVHKAGVVGDKSQFIEVVLKAAGMNGNGKEKEENQARIESFFGADEYTNTIVLLEVKDSRIPFMEHSRIRILLNFLVGYGIVIYQLAQKHLDELHGITREATKEKNLDE